MGLPLRIQGRDVQVIVVKGGAQQEPLTDVRSLEATFNIERKKENYLGERSPRHDETWEGVTGKLDLHVHSAGSLNLIKDLKLRAQRNLPNFQVNIIATFDFEDGPTQVLFPDVKFGAIPLSVSGRSEYVGKSLDWGCDDFDVIG